MYNMVPAVLGQGRGAVELYDYPFLIGVMCLIFGLYIIINRSEALPPWRDRVNLGLSSLVLASGLFLWYSRPLPGTIIALLGGLATIWCARRRFQKH